MVRNAILPVTLALATVTALALLDAPARDLLEALGWNAPEGGAYDTLFETVAGVAGVFLALYFTAVSAVAASVYVNVPHEIRALIVRDRVGNIYVSGVAFAIALATFLLVAHTLSGDQYVLAAPLVGLLAAFSIFAFIRLGQRAFYLADPTLLADTLTREFRGWLRRARVGGWHWRDPSFQDHYRGRARQSVDAITSLLALAGGQPHLRGASVRNLSRQAVVLVVGYLGARSTIPTKSRWFGSRPKHKQWYLAGGMEVDGANMTSTALSPEIVPDVDWVERPILRQLSNLIDQDLAREEYAEAYAILAQLEPVWVALGRSWEADEGLEWVATITKRALARLRDFEREKSALEPASIPAVWDAIAMLPMSLELGFHRYVMEHEVPDLRARIEAIDLSEERSPYSLDLPRAAVEALEQMVAGNEFERVVAATPETMTPGWFVAEKALFAYEGRLFEQVNALIEFLSKWYPETAKEAMAAGSADAAGAILARGMESIWKLESHLAAWEEVAAALRSDPERVDFKRPEWDWDSARASLRLMRRELTRTLAASIGAQSVLVRDDGVPDYLGEAVNRVGEACFEALEADDAPMFRELFNSYAVGVFVVISRVKGQVSALQPEVATTLMVEPAIDLLELSGYALIFSELHSDPALWETCTEAWDRLGKEMLNLEAMAAMHSFHRNRFGFSARSSIRHRWQARLQSVLEELPHEKPSSRFRAIGEVRHPSCLIRRIAPDDELTGLQAEASDVFVQSYLARLDGAEGLDFGVPDHVVDLLGDEGEEPEERP